MDEWNPIVGEDHIQHVPFWMMAVILTVGGFMIAAGGWAIAILVLSLERIAS